MTPDMMDSWMDITGATDAAYTVMDADEGYHLRATAMYADGEGMGKMASMADHDGDHRPRIRRQRGRRSERGGEHGGRAWR